MKSDSEQLSLRGYIKPYGLQKYSNKTKTELLTMLYSDIATDRTCAATLLVQFIDDEVSLALIDRLKVEKKLYTKLAICETLSKGDETTIDLLAPNLGMIGNNQHKKLPEKPFEKKSYPLPRDIIARTLCKMGTKPLCALDKILFSGDYIQKLEAVDAIGFILYYEKNEALKPSVIKMIDIYENDELMIWKLLRALSAFNGQDVKNILQRYENSNVEQLAWESKRSKKQIVLRQN